MIDTIGTRPLLETIPEGVATYYATTNGDIIIIILKSAVIQVLIARRLPVRYRWHVVIVVYFDCELCGDMGSRSRIKGERKMAEL